LIDSSSQPHIQLSTLQLNSRCRFCCLDPSRKPIWRRTEQYTAPLYGLLRHSRHFSFDREKKKFPAKDPTSTTKV
jgi:hypothetical protein